MSNFLTSKTHSLLFFLITLLIINSIPYKVFAAPKDEDWVVVHINEIRILKNNWRDLGVGEDSADFRFLMIAPHSNGRETSFVYPSNGTISASQGEIIEVGESGLSIRAAREVNSIQLFLIGIDSDQLPDEFNRGVGTFISFAIDRIMEHVDDLWHIATKFGSIWTWLAGEAASQGISFVSEFIQENDNIGEAVLVLNRSDKWLVDGRQHKIISSNKVLEFTYEVRIASPARNTAPKSAEEVRSPGNYTWTSEVQINSVVDIGLMWCATNSATLDENWKSMSYNLTSGTYIVQLNLYPLISRQREDGASCKGYMQPILVLPSGKHTSIWNVEIKKQINDGWETFKPGKYVAQTTTGTYKEDTLTIINTGWCAIDRKTLDSNWSNLEFELIVNGTKVNITNIQSYIENRTDKVCRIYPANLMMWSPGIHSYQWTQVLNRPVNDGWNIYPQGTYNYQYKINVFR